MSDYRNLIVWQKAKNLAVAVHRAVAESRVAKFFGLRDQMLRAAISIPSNIAEGYAREKALDRSHFLNIARGSCAELETQLYIAEESGLLPAERAGDLRAVSEEVSRMLFTLRARIREHTK